VLFQKILYGYNARKGDIEDIIAGSLTTKKTGETETLLQAILCCGVYELLAHNDIDAAIIINDYLDVAHGFYESGQVKLINGVLDKAAKALRS
jgi:N utilization substance protein B